MLRLPLREVFGNHFADQEFLLDALRIGSSSIGAAIHALPCSIRCDEIKFHSLRRDKTRRTKNAFTVAKNSKNL